MAPAESNGNNGVLPRRRPISRLVERPAGPATVLSIATANPPTINDQATYTDRVFEICNIGHDEELKGTFRHMIDTSCIKKRHTFLSDEVLKAHPELCTYWDTTLTTRTDMANSKIPELAKEAAIKAIEEWGRPLTEITHMVMATTTMTGIPGADLKVARMLGLRPTVQRVCMYQTGCWGGGGVMRVAKDLAESAKGARVLVIAAEGNTIMNFRAPTKDTMFKVDFFQAHVTFGDGAAALIVGSDPLPGVERPLFEMYRSTQMSPPNTESAMTGTITEAGLVQHLTPVVPKLLAQYLPEFLSEGRDLVGSPDWTDMFWVVHPGAYRILEVVAEVMGLPKEKLQPSWDTLENYGNMSSPTCLFVLNELRNRSKRLGESTTGGGCEWGVLLGLGPGFNMEFTLMRSVPFTS